MQRKISKIKMNYKYIQVYIDDELVDSWLVNSVDNLSEAFCQIVTISEMV